MDAALVGDVPEEDLCGILEEIPAKITKSFREQGKTFSEKTISFPFNYFGDR